MAHYPYLGLVIPFTCRGVGCHLLSPGCMHHSVHNMYIYIYICIYVYTYVSRYYDELNSTDMQIERRTCGEQSHILCHCTFMFPWRCSMTCFMGVCVYAFSFKGSPFLGGWFETKRNSNIVVSRQPSCLFFFFVLGGGGGRVQWEDHTDKKASHVPLSFHVPVSAGVEIRSTRIDPHGFHSCPFKSFIHGGSGPHSFHSFIDPHSLFAWWFRPPPLPRFN